MMLTAALVLGLLGSASAKAATTAEVPLPTLQGPLPASAASYPFNGAAYNRTPIDLARTGYVEEEYFQSGTAKVYDWPAPNRLDVIGEGPYVTRILVRRPKDPKRFNGAVIVEPLNSSHMIDVDLMWIYAHDELMAQGYAWVGVTVKPVSAAALKRFDPQRYAAVSLASPLPPDKRCPDLELGPTDTSSEIGLAFDILSQVGALVRSTATQNPLRAYNVSRVYMTGYSQTAGYTRTYASTLAPLAARPGGGRIYDGYLAGGQGPFNVVMNTCTAPFSPGDPRLMFGALGVPYIDVAGEGDTLTTNFMRRPDSDQAPDLFRRYEIAGSTHTGTWITPFTPRQPDLDRSGARDTDTSRCLPSAPALSHFPLPDVMTAMWRNLDAWVTGGTPPPRASRLVLKDGPTHKVTLKDANGAAVGGVRTVAVEVPTTLWHSSREGPPSCMLIGYAEPYDRAKLKALYPTHADYLRRVETSIGRLLAERWLTQGSAQRILDEAKAANIP